MPPHKKQRFWEPDNPHQHWPDRHEVKDAFARAENRERYAEYYIDSDGKIKSDDLALDIDIMGRSLTDLRQLACAREA